MARNGKAVETGESAGFIKLVVDATADRLLGAAVLASDGAKLAHVLQRRESRFPCTFQPLVLLERSVVLAWARARTQRQ
jgi:hypothetical protein